MSQGFSTILELASYFFTVLLVLIIHFFLTYGSLLFLLTKVRLVYFYSKMKNAILFAFSISNVLKNGGPFIGSLPIKKFLVTLIKETKARS